jgi:acyl-CoA synthetase (AMP-forming)/AMP-acid ligase II
VAPVTTTTEHSATTLSEVFAATAAAHASEPALRTPDGAITWTWSEYAERVNAAAAGLHGIGVRRGDTVALWLSNRPEFHVADTAATQLGAAPFSIYLPMQLAWTVTCLADPRAIAAVLPDVRPQGVATVNAPGAVRDRHRRPRHAGRGGRAVRGRRGADARARRHARLPQRPDATAEALDADG